MWYRGKDTVTTHALRETATSILLEAGNSDPSVAMRTDHRDLKPLKNYQNLSGAIGRQQGEGIQRNTNNDSKRSSNLNTEVVNGVGDWTKRVGDAAKRMKFDTIAQ